MQIDQAQIKQMQKMLVLIRRKGKNYQVGRIETLIPQKWEFSSKKNRKGEDDEDFDQDTGGRGGCQNKGRAPTKKNVYFQALPESGGEAPARKFWPSF